MFEPLRWRIFAAWVVTGLLLAPMPSRTRGLLVQFHRASAKPVSCWQQSQAPGPCAVRLACWNRPRPALKTVHTISIDQRALHTYEADGGCTADRAGGRTVAAQAPNPGGSRAGVGPTLATDVKTAGPRCLASRGRPAGPAILPEACCPHRHRGRPAERGQDRVLAERSSVGPEPGIRWRSYSAGAPPAAGTAVFGASEPS